MQPVAFTSKFVSSFPVYGEVYSIQRYVTKFRNDLRQVVAAATITTKLNATIKYEIMLTVTLNHNNPIINQFRDRFQN